MKKKILTTLIVVLGLASIFLLGKIFSPGSYSNVEKYEFDVNESEIISRINNFKDENPQFRIPLAVGLSDGRNNAADHWYHVYFYYPQENQIIYAWTRPNGTQKTTMALVSVNKGLRLGNWQDINKNLNAEESADQKRKFEERILQKIKHKN